MMTEINLRIGCAIWAYKGWVGDLFPTNTRSSEFLRLYSQHFPTVEGNTTFYSIPDARTVNRWVSETPPGFQFCPKLPKSLTHAGLLQPQIEATRRFIDQMQGLGDRLGPIFAQLPPRYAPDRLSDLEAFLTALSSQTTELALEVRHLDWFTEPHRDRLTELLTRLSVGRVLLDTRPIYEAEDDPQLHSERKKPQVPLELSVTAPFTLIRYISHPDRAANQPYLDQWVTQINQWQQQGTRIYCFVHCPVEARSPANARQLHHLLEQRGVSVPSLPWLPEPIAQLKLF